MPQPEANDVRVVKVGPLGPYENNGYVIIDSRSGESLIVDMPGEGERLLQAAHGTRVTAIVLTHAHVDHLLSYDLITHATGAPVLAHEAEKGVGEDKVQKRLADGEMLTLGKQCVRVVHTPGHTPGSICLLVGKHLIAGDTLFPGGPGHTDYPEELQQETRSIVGRLYVLADNTIVYPGHGPNTTIGESKKEFAVFASREQPAGLCGDVTWT
ncbi:MAG: MBL fold metallo-hydrolase [Dehalococcoidia bacterium]|jgi:glyoxylase-like metal-dependent hydrolase (beta-lactamase superfamily II)